jgi:hypothetical protein
VCAQETATEPGAEALHGVSLEQYAGIITALADEFPLAAILANEEIARSSWPKAELAWMACIARDGTSGPVLARFRDKRVVDEDTLDRGVTPIDADLAAWMSFLQAYGAHRAPFEMLGQAGLRLNDMSRLQRRWSRRLAADEALRRQAAELAKKGLGPLPPLRVQPGALKPFPWSRGPLRKATAPPLAPKVVAPADTSMAPGKLRLFSYVAVKAHLAESPGDEKRELAKLGVQDFATTDAGWQEILRNDPDLERDYQTLLATQRSKLRAAKRAPGTSDRPTPAPAPPRPAEASPLAVSAPPPAAALGTVAPAPRAAAKLAGTALALDMPQKAALPFVESAHLATPSAGPEPPAPRAAATLAGTALALDVPHNAALPFGGTAPPAPPAPPVPNRPPAELTGTSFAVDVPRRPALPFDAGAPTSGAALPLTVEQHASLCCEIAEAPERALETLARYGITPAQKRAADQHYSELFAREPGARPMWDRAYQVYRAWWLANRVSR